MDRIVVVGASLAGFRAAEALRAQGFDGALTLVGEEPHQPYDRPPLSKQVLTGDWDVDRIVLPSAAPNDDGADPFDWRLGERAVGLDLGAREVELADGGRLGFDGLVIATGCRPRTIGGEGLAGVHVLRTLDDALALRADLERGPSRVAVIGAGFIGSEVAASCRARGLDVTVIEALPVPLERALGADMGALVGDLHREHDVDLRLGVGVDGFTSAVGGANGAERVTGVRLADGTTVDAEVVVVGIGVIPNTEWLEGSGLTLDNGVLCDATTQAAPGVVAAGDIARWPNPRFGGEVMRVEHWDNAIEMAQAAAARLLAASDEVALPYEPVPWFWSDLYDRKIQLAGRSGPDDEVQVVTGDVAERRFVALYGRAGRLVGALGWNRPRHVMQWRQRLTEGMDWQDALELARSEP
ncbi:MAG: NAD(P)/FAD-dependent oxidoreductase [Acidimicrobiales bacterium]|nr:NAD(P)/FAD-dependent oxidoreductase [Acidimicrobiales bacterium]